MRNACRTGLFLLIAACPLALAASTGSATSVPRERVLVLAEGLRPGQLPRAIRFMEGEVLVDAAESGAALALLPAGRGAALERDGRIRIYRQSDAAAEAQKLAGVDPWRSAVIGACFGAREEPGPLPPHAAVVPPPWWELTAPEAAGDEAVLDGARPRGANWQNTSEFFAGRISLNLLLPESDGRVETDSESWLPEEEGRLLGETLRALADLAELLPQGSPRFVVHLLSGRTDGRLATGLEPIDGVLGSVLGDGPERWGNEILEHLGVTDGDFLARSRWFADITRLGDRSDWAVNAFVVRAEKDDDGAFADGRSARAWLGGPHFVLSSRAGSTRPGGRVALLRHLLLHAFHALDQGEGCRCGRASGYLAAANTNCGDACGAPVADVMSDGRLETSPTTRAQLGLGDSDDDGVPDLFDMDPELQLEPATEEISCDGLVMLRGTARVTAFPNLNPSNSTPRRDIVLGRIDRIEIRVDNGGWQRGLVYAADGEFDGAEEVFEAGIRLRSGRHHIELRAIDDQGNVSRGASRAADVAEKAVPVGPSLVLQSSSSGPTLRWREAPGAAAYRILRAKDPDGIGTSAPVLSTATTSWADPTPGISFYRVVSVDGCGRVESRQQSK